MGETIRIKDLPEKEFLSPDDLFVNSDTITTAKVTARQIADYVAQSDEIDSVVVKKEDVGQPMGVAPLDSSGRIDGTYITYGTDDFTAFPGSEGEKLKENKVDKIEGKGLSSNDFTDAEKNKLACIAEEANKYTHPDTHPAGMIQSDAEHRFVTDTEKDKWNSNLNNANSYSDMNYQQATEYTDEKIAALINGAPTTLDTLKEIADAMEENQNVVTALEESIGKKANESEFDSHVKDKSNPHNVTKAQIGLGNVDNTSNMNKPVSAAQQEALDTKVNKSGDTMTGALAIHKTDGEPCTFFQAKRTDTDTAVAMGIGDDGITHGLYSGLLDKWICYANNDSVFFNGKSASAVRTPWIDISPIRKGDSLDGYKGGTIIRFLMCESEDIAKSLKNCPTSKPFIMISGNWYQEIIESSSSPNIYIRSVINPEDKTNWILSEWRKVCTATVDAFIPEIAYSTTEPDTVPENTIVFVYEEE